MFLKSLTLKGFKSFADTTKIELEPGITVVVGPNGSGKSNLVDAIGWVLGAQAPSVVRSKTMDDVIFAGTSARQALGRAEVALTVDNSAGLLPIDFTEVTVSRTLFRDGDSEYALNGVPCRLLDVQELLSDTGVGRQQHVIVSQGQIDAVLNARPEDRRLIIEEAAGILKYRKRRERAERRLTSTEANLNRLQDLLREVRRQLRPLERQAEAARRHAEFADELRVVRRHLAGRQIEALRRRGADLEEQHGEVTREEDEVTSRLRRLDDDVQAAETELSAAGDDDLGDLLVGLESLRERARGLAALIGERRRGAARDRASLADQGVIFSLEQEAAGLVEQLEQVRAERAELDDTRVESEETEAVDPLTEEAAAAVREAEARVDAAERVWLDAEAARHGLAARAETLDAALHRASAAADALGDQEGSLGTLADLVDVDNGWGPAFEAAVGDALGAVVVADGEAARSALAALERGDVDADVLPVLDGSGAPESEAPGQWLRSHVRGHDARVDRLLDHLVAGVLVVDTWDEALDHAARTPGATIVTRSGGRFAPTGWRVRPRGALATPAAVDDARRQADVAEQRAITSRAELDAARRGVLDARRREAERRAEREADREARRTELRVRAAALDERIDVLTRRRDDVEKRLARDDEERREAKGQRLRIEQTRPRPRAAGAPGGQRGC